jgi:hypothetical protein
VEDGGICKLKELDGNRALKLLGLFFSGRLRLMRVCGAANSSGVSKSWVLFDQILDSVIVGGITGVSAYVYAGEDASWKAATLSFLLTFLIKMKEYRKIS